MNKEVMKSISLIGLILIVMNNCSHEIKSNISHTSQYNGTWAESEEENALFVIKGDTVENVEHGDRMYFNVLNDTMTIDYVDSSAKYFIVKSSDDSLILQNPDKSVIRLYRRRE
jgi:hypothetical protein